MVDINTGDLFASEKRKIRIIIISEGEECEVAEQESGKWETYEVEREELEQVLDKDHWDYVRNSSIPEHQRNFVQLAELMTDEDKFEGKYEEGDVFDYPFDKRKEMLVTDVDEDEEYEYRVVVHIGGIVRSTYRTHEEMLDIQEKIDEDKDINLEY